MKARRRGSLALPILFAILVGSAAPSVALAAAEDWDWNYNALIGRRSVDEDDWEPFDDYSEIGVEGSWGKADEPLLFATDLYMSQASTRDGTSTITSQQYQIQLGLRKIWTFSKRWNPYGGAGFTLADADAERKVGTEIETSRDDAYGVWVGGGIFYRIGRNFNLGVAARVSLMRGYRLFGVERAGNATHLGVVIGWGAERGGDN